MIEINDTPDSSDVLDYRLASTTQTMSPSPQSIPFFNIDAAHAFKKPVQ